jgi:hypothetical protein
MNRGDYRLERPLRILSFVDQHARQEKDILDGRPTHFSVWRMDAASEEFGGFRTAVYCCARVGADCLEHALVITYVTTTGRVVATVMETSDVTGGVNYRVKHFCSHAQEASWLRREFRRYSTVTEILHDPVGEIFAFLSRVGDPGAVA